MLLMNSPFTEWLCLLHYSENLAIIKCPCVGVYIEILCFFHWSIYLHQNPQYLKYYKSIKVIDTFFCKPPGLVLLYVIFDKFCLLHVHTNFGISLVISKKKILMRFWLWWYQIYRSVGKNWLFNSIASCNQHMW